MAKNGCNFNINKLIAFPKDKASDKLNLSMGESVR